jgi:hypothetical protein
MNKIYWEYFSKFARNIDNINKKLHAGIHSFSTQISSNDI